MLDLEPTEVPNAFRKTVKLFADQVYLPSEYSEFWTPNVTKQILQKLSAWDKEAYLADFDTALNIFLKLKQYFKKELWNGYKGVTHDPSHVSLSKEPVTRY